MGRSDDAPSAENISFQKIIAIVGIALMAMKFAAWAMTSSVSVLTDALESIVNVLAAFMGLYALHLSAKPRDRTHPYGHGKVELISSLVEGMMILTAGAMIIIEAADRIMHPEEVGNLDIGLALLAFAAIVNLAVGMAAIRRGRRNRSPALVASGKHLCSDTISSIGVIAGLAVMMALDFMGFEVGYVDSIMAAVFGAVIMITGAKVVKESMDGVMDRSDDALIGEVMEQINSRRHSHWIDIHNLRVTKYGSVIHMELHVVFPGMMTVAEQSREISEIREAVNGRFSGCVDVTVMGEACTTSMCGHCSEECGCRAEEFKGFIDWTAFTATDEDENHSADVD